MASDPHRALRLRARQWAQAERGRQPEAARLVDDLLAALDAGATTVASAGGRNVGKAAAGRVLAAWPAGRPATPADIVKHVGTVPLTAETVA